MQKLWLEQYSASFIIKKIRDLRQWELGAGARGKKKNWARFYSNCFKQDWDEWNERTEPSKPQEQKLHPIAAAAEAAVAKKPKYIPPWERDQ